MTEEDHQMLYSKMKKPTLNAMVGSLGRVNLFQILHGLTQYSGSDTILMKIERH